MAETLITRGDVEQYIHDTLPWNELTDWDLEGITDDVLERWPDIVGHHPELLDAPIGALGGRTGWYIEHHIDSDAYWEIVAGRQTESST